MLVGRCQGEYKLKKEEKMLLIKQVPRGKWNQERVDGLALDMNGVYINVQLQIIL